MNADEFLNTISEKGKLIVEEYIRNFKKKATFTVTLTDESYVKYADPDKYLIFVDSGDKSNIEYHFLHEFFHCVQHEEDFSSIYPCNPKQKQFAEKFESYFLDYNVRHMLETYSYYIMKKSSKHIMPFLIFFKF